LLSMSKFVFFLMFPLGKLILYLRNIQVGNTQRTDLLPVKYSIEIDLL